METTAQQTALNEVVINKVNRMIETRQSVFKPQWNA